MLPILQIGPLAIQTYGLILLISLWLGLLLSEKLAPQKSLSIDDLYNLVFTMLIAGIIGARLGYFIQAPNLLQENPIALFALDPSLLDPFSGVTFGSLAGYIFGYRKKINQQQLLDTLTPALATLMIGFGLANLAAGSGYGSETTLPWGIQLWGAIRHPSQIYETISAAIILILIFYKWNKSKLKDGFLFLYFITFSAGSKLFLEAFRGDSSVLTNGLRINQIFAWFILAICLWVLWQPLSTKESTTETTI